MKSTAGACSLLYTSTIHVTDSTSWHKHVCHNKNEADQVKQLDCPRKRLNYLRLNYLSIKVVWNMVFPLGITWPASTCQDLSLARQEMKSKLTPHRLVVEEPGGTSTSTLELESQALSTRYHVTALLPEHTSPWQQQVTLFSMEHSSNQDTFGID